ncbi:MAG: ABC transporter ATP-binding protein, partial [Planctomycetales bacterium]
ASGESHRPAEQAAMRVNVLGQDVRQSSDALRGRIGYMAEAASVVPVLKGVEFVMLSGDLYGMPHQQARRRAHEVLYYVGLGELRYRRLEEYSTGNLQRLKLADALVHDPDLLLLDEPTGGLDPAGRTGFLNLLEDLIKDTGKSVILSTHLLGDVERLCEQVVFLHEGQVAHCGPRSKFRRVVQHHYEIGWQGDGDGFLKRLQEAGATVESKSGEGNRAAAVVPTDWTTLRFFALARESDAVLTHLKSREDDLQQLFHEVTEKESTDGN